MFYACTTPGHFDVTASLKGNHLVIVATSVLVATTFILVAATSTFATEFTLPLVLATSEFSFAMVTVMTSFSSTFSFVTSPEVAQDKNKPIASQLDAVYRRTFRPQDHFRNPALPFYPHAYLGHPGIHLDHRSPLLAVDRDHILPVALHRIAVVHGRTLLVERRQTVVAHDHTLLAVLRRTVGFLHCTLVAVVLDHLRSFGHRRIDQTERALVWRSLGLDASPGRKLEDQHSLFAFKKRVFL